jgi:hypothetical protein
MSPPGCAPTACRSIRSSTSSALFLGPFRKIVSSLSRLWPELNRSKSRTTSRCPHRTRPCSEVITQELGTRFGVQSCSGMAAITARTLAYSGTVTVDTLLHRVDIDKGQGVPAGQQR